jgi:outer membrane biosynthesis protein TonB
MDYAVVHHCCSTLQLQSAAHNFDSQRLHMEAKPNNPGCKGLPSASWSVVLIFNTPEQCVAARQYLEKARLELLDKRAKLVSQILAGDSEQQKEPERQEPQVEEAQPEPEAEPAAEPETDAPPVDAPAPAEAEGEGEGEGGGD